MSTIVTRSGKGSPLTNTEMDSNLTNLNTDKIETSSIVSASSKTTPVDADLVPVIDSEASNVLKKLTWANLKSTIKSYYDAVSSTLTNKTINLTSNTLVTTLAQLNSAVSDADLPSTTGSGASGTWGISISGNASTATNSTNITGSTTASIPTGAIGSGTADSTKYLRGDRTFVDAPSIGRHTIWIPAGAMIPRTSNGAAIGTAESTTNKVMLKTLDFDAAADEFAQFFIRMPKSWNESTVTAEFVWSSASTGNCVWGIQGVAIGDDDAFDAAFGTAQTVTDGVTATTDIMKTAETSAITIANAAENDWVVFQVYRDADNGSDTLGGDARLHGVVVFYTTNGANDA